MHLNGGMVAYACNLITQEAFAGKLKTERQPRPHSRILQKGREKAFAI